MKEVAFSGRGCAISQASASLDANAIRGSIYFTDKNGNTLPGHISFVREIGERVELRIQCQGRELIGSASPSDWAAAACTGPVNVQFIPGAGTILTC